jgi:hypothetical protein
VKRLVDVRFVAVALVVGVVGGIALAVGLFKPGADNEDRSQIIVRSGSVTLDQDKKWKFDDGSAKTARQDHANGAPVTDYAVKIENASYGDSENVPCPKATMVATSLDIEYTSRPSTVKHVKVSISSSTGSAEPLITADDAMTADNSASPPRLTYEAGAGWLSKITLSDSSGPVQSCRFGDPGVGNKGNAVITVKPRK